jgi:hypothetical protein
MGEQMSDTTFTTSDKASLAQRNISVPEATRQLAQLRRGKAFLPIKRPCTIGDGMLRIDDNTKLESCRSFARSRDRFTRFVPASGAASRMFQGLFPAELDAEKVARLRQDLDAFPFYPDLKEIAGPPEALDDAKLCGLLLESPGLGLAGKPKGLLPLHRGTDYNRTAFAEHLFESTRLGISRFHFTVSPEHLELFKQELAQVEQKLSDKIDVSFSLQSPQTDTIALDRQNNGPFRDADGNLLFRPAGHGALLKNLEECEGDLVLIRNIDNVVPKRLQEPYQFWTEVLGGQLLQVQQQVFDWIDKLEDDPSAETCAAAAAFVEATFGRSAIPGVTSRELIKLLDRPIRIGGMVPVSGQPGGGPFWTRDALGQISPQIIEGVQIDPDDPEQQEILAASTHFNPVNIACSLRNRHGKPYRLNKFIDEDAALIAAKSSAGRDLLALERPGLWNGAMSGWNTIFVELPDETFNPIKTVFDLLLPAHQVDK